MRKIMAGTVNLAGIPGAFSSAIGGKTDVRSSNSSSRKKRRRDTTRSHTRTRDASGVWPPTGLLLRAVCLFAAFACSQGLIEADRQYLDSLYAELGGDNWAYKANWTVPDAVGWGVDVETDENGTDHVVRITLESNKLVGTLPDVESGQLAHLEYLYLGNNSISGPLPAGLENLVAIRRIEIDDNLLTGNIPPEIGSLPSLERLELQNNALTGEIPSELGNLSSLTWLGLHDNSLSEEIPSELGNVATLVRLYLQNNNFEGLLPVALGKLSSLQQLDLSGNADLIGPIPPQFGDLVSLKGLDLNGNSLTEEIPSELGDLGQGGSLTFVDLSDNFLTGEVPDGLEEVNELHLDGNFIEGYAQRADDDLTAPPYPTPPPTPSPTVAPTRPPERASTLDPTPAPTRTPTAAPTALSPSPSPPTTASDPDVGASGTDDDDDNDGSGGDGGSDSGSQGLDAGSIVGVAFAAAAVIVGGWCCWTRRKPRERGSPPKGWPAGGGSGVGVGGEKIRDGGGRRFRCCGGRGWFGRFPAFGTATPSVHGRCTSAEKLSSCVADADAERTVDIPSSATVSWSAERPSHCGPESRRGGAPNLAWCGDGNPRDRPAFPSGDTQISTGGSSVGGQDDDVGVSGSALPAFSAEEEAAPSGGPHPDHARRGYWESRAGWGPFKLILRSTKSAAADIPRTRLEEPHEDVWAYAKARSRSVNLPLPPDTRSDLVDIAQNDRQQASLFGRSVGTAETGVAGFVPPGFQPGLALSGHGSGMAGGRHGSERSGGGSGGTYFSSGPGRMDGVLEMATRVSRAAQNSSIVGVPEVATLVETLVNLAADHRGNREAFEKIRNLLQCLTRVLESVKELLSKNSHLNPGGGMILVHVEEKVRALVEVMMAYQGGGRMMRTLQASFYKSRVNEAEAAVRHTLDYLTPALHAYSLRRMDEVSENLARITDSPSVRRIHHQQNLIESEAIPEGSIEISDLIIGSGGASNVYMAHYAGENVAAKVVTIKGNDRGEIDKQEKSFLEEVRNMRRLNNSPRVVRVFGIVTWRPGELVLVMKYMSGGDLFSFIQRHRERDEEIDEKLARNLIGHAAEGMKYLHQQRTSHGDLKSLNILLDAHNNAHISDFGTSHWTEETKSKVLQSSTPGARAVNQLSIQWAAPEVSKDPSLIRIPFFLALLVSSSDFLFRCVEVLVERLRNSAYLAWPGFVSDVYSFGIVVWEVLSRKVPWEGLSARDMRIKVCIEGTGPPMPSSAPPDLAELARACWQIDPEHRPTFDDIVKYLNEEDAPLLRRGEGIVERGEILGAGRSDSDETVSTERVSRR
ncbi:unnamed protein product [Scytosiphon promiscuus]